MWCARHENQVRDSNSLRWEAGQISHLEDLESLKVFESLKDLKFREVRAPEGEEREGAARVFSCSPARPSVSQAGLLFSAAFLSICLSVSLQLVSLPGCLFLYVFPSACLPVPVLFSAGPLSSYLPVPACISAVCLPTFKCESPPGIENSRRQRSLPPCAMQ